MKSIVKNGIFNVIYQIANIIFPLLITMYVSRALCSDGVGRVSYAQNVATYFISFAALGIPIYGIREISRNQSDKLKTNQTFTELWVINLITTLISTFAYMLLISSVYRFKSDYLLFLVFGLQIFMNIINIDWLYQGTENYVYIAFRSVFIKLLSLLAIVLFVKTKDDYILYALISVMAVTGNYAFNVIHARKIVRLDFKSLNLRRHLKPVFLFGCLMFLSSLYSKVDITMLGIMTTDSMTGLYSNSIKIINVLLGICTALSAVFLPRLSYLFEDNICEFRNLVSYGGELITFIAIPMCVGTIILAPQIILIMFGNDFVGAISILRILSVLIVIKSFGDLFCYQVLTASQNEERQIPIYCVAAIINIILNYTLIPFMKADGAALASVISELIVNGIELTVVRKIIKIEFSLVPLLQSVFSSLIMAFAICMCIRLFNGLLLKAIVSFAVGVLIYFTINLLFKNKIATTIMQRVKKIITDI